MLMTTYTPTIGIEIHAELSTQSKMFCGCPNNPHANEPNANVCPVCLAHPGTLPVVNKEAVKHVLTIGTALGGEIATYSEFDRKNYFYPDIPKAYQISQYEFPFVKGGSLAGVAITRVHLEEDTARSLHDKGDGSVVDFNRAGVPLMELVTEPVIHDAATAANFARELQLLLRTLGASDANMERGEMRVEANISISSTETLGTKVEVKNLNSFRSVEMAILYEIERQTAEITSNRAIFSETRGWDEQKSVTFSQRTKETADDYRYFPDPDIPKFDLVKIPEFDKSRLKETLPELPSKIRTNLRDLGIKEETVELMLGRAAFLSFFRETVAHLNGDADTIRLAVNYLTSDILGICERDPEKQLDDHQSIQFSELVKMVAANEITSRVAKDLLPEVVFDGADPRILAKERNILQQNSEDDLLPVVETVLADNPAVVAEYKAGKEASIQFLVGQGMKATRGAANPELLLKLLKDKMTD